MGPCDTLKSDTFLMQGNNNFPHDVKMKIIKCYPNTKGIAHHYCQSGGNIPVFVGSPIQRGSRLGQILSGLFKQALPILKKKVLPAVVHSGKEGVIRHYNKQERGKTSLIRHWEESHLRICGKHSCDG